MAVFQISRIQIRRGQVNQSTGLPQLASGEMAWAIDTQELFIGNGSVSEGAPAVGNTKVLTVNDLTANGSILSIVQYSYKLLDTTVTTGPTADSPVFRLLQSKVEETVSVKDFGATGTAQRVDSLDPSLGYTGTDDTQALQRSINQMFVNRALKASHVNGAVKRNTLHLPAGVYITTDTIYIPSYASIQGAGQDKTIIYYNPVSTISATTTNLSTTVAYPSVTNRMLGAHVAGSNIPSNTVIQTVTLGVGFTISNQATASGIQSLTITKLNPAVQFVNDLSSTNATNPSVMDVSAFSTTTSTNQPRAISFKDLTVIVAGGKSPALQLDAVKDSYFSDIGLNGSWNNSLYSRSSGVVLNAFSTLVTCKGNHFNDLEVTDFSYGVSSYHDITDNLFINAHINSCYQGFVLGFNVVAGIQSTGATGSNQQYGPSQTVLLNPKFQNIKRHAVYIGLGKGNVIQEAKLENVGAEGAGNILASNRYPQIYYNSQGNINHNTQSDRLTDFPIANTAIPYTPEIGGIALFSSSIPTTVSIQGIPNSFCFRLPPAVNASGAPVGSITYSIDYLYISSNHGFTRKGKLSISADIDSALLQLSDEYDFAGVDTNLSIAPVLDFSVKFTDQVGADYTGAPGQVPSSIVVVYSNYNTSVFPSGDFGTLYYTYSSIASPFAS